MKREKLSSGSNWEPTIGYSQAVSAGSPSPTISPYATAVAIGVASGILVLCGWRYLPNLVYVSLLSYFTPLPLVFGATVFLARRHPSIGQRLAMLTSVSFESVIFSASIALGAPPQVVGLQLATGFIIICTALLAVRLGGRKGSQVY